MKRIAIISLAVFFSLCSITSACPLCSDSTAMNSHPGRNVPAGLFNASVLWILGGFLGVTGLLAVKIVGAVRLIGRRI